MGRKAATSAIGSRYGILTVVDQRMGNHGTECLCQCDCGVIKWISLAHLTDKRRPVKSCGCLGRARQASIAIGQRFGALTVMSIAGPGASGDRQYLCRCDCGGTIVATAYQLTHGTVASCGCKLRQARHDIGSRSAAGVSACVADGVNLPSAMRGAANRNSKSGYRGVWYSPRRNCYIASVQVRGERWHGYGYVTAESAKAARDIMHSKLLDKYGVTSLSGSEHQ